MMKIRILIVDNEPRWIAFAKQDLEMFDIVVAKTAREALDQLEEDRFDLVIASSWNIDVLKIISEKFSDKRLVVATIKSNTDEAIQAYRFGAVNYFPKSFRQKYLLNHVKGALPNQYQKFI